jgi:mRNA-degrading endonuclease toxin of MazEF toxin-antitoxin module
MIVIASVRMKTGGDKPRTAMVFTPDSIIPTATHLDLIAITSSYRPDDPDAIPLPWQPDGRGPTRLKKDSAAVADETDLVPIAEIQKTWGYVPARQLAAVLTRLKVLGKS